MMRRKNDVFSYGCEQYLNIPDENTLQTVDHVIEVPKIKFVAENGGFYSCIGFSRAIHSEPLGKRLDSTKFKRIENPKTFQRRASTKHRWHSGLRRGYQRG